MKLFLVALGVALFHLQVCLAGAPPILGGQAVLSTDFISRSVVALIASRSQSQALCTASLVGPNLAITAAHCVSDPTNPAPATLSLIFSLNIKNANSNQLREVDRVEIPSEWLTHENGISDTSDVALLHFKGDLPAGYQYSDLLALGHVFQVGDEVMLAGYGISNAALSSGAGILRRTTVSVKTPHFSPSEIEFDQSQGGGACHGDSGGPAYVVISGHPYLFGITSRGAGACDEEVIYTEIASYAEWFRTAVAKLKRGPQ